MMTGEVPYSAESSGGEDTSGLVQLGLGVGGIVQQIAGPCQNCSHSSVVRRVNGEVGRAHGPYSILETKTVIVMTHCASWGCECSDPLPIIQPPPDVPGYKDGRVES